MNISSGVLWFVLNFVAIKGLNGVWKFGPLLHFFVGNIHSSYLKSQVIQSGVTVRCWVEPMVEINIIESTWLVDRDVFDHCSQVVFFVIKLIGSQLNGSGVEVAMFEKTRGEFFFCIWICWIVGLVIFPRGKVFNSLFGFDPVLVWMKKRLAF